MIGCHDRIALLRWKEGMTAGKQIGTAVVYMYFRRYSYSRKQYKSAKTVKPLPVDLPH